MKIRKTNDGRLLFYCEGCEMLHGVTDIWNFNNDYDKPTFTPSVLVKGTVPLTDEEYDLLIKGETVTPTPFVCHSFVTDGKIQYLNDCTHKLAGQTVELKDEQFWYELEG